MIEITFSNSFSSLRDELSQLKINPTIKYRISPNIKTRINPIKIKLETPFF
jgi:hypothetical protein